MKHQPGRRISCKVPTTLSPYPASGHLFFTDKQPKDAFSPNATDLQISSSPFPQSYHSRHYPANLIYKYCSIRETRFLLCHQRFSSNLLALPLHACSRLLLHHPAHARIQGSRMYIHIYSTTRKHDSSQKSNKRQIYFMAHMLKKNVLNSCVVREVRFRCVLVSVLACLYYGEPFFDSCFAS